MQAMDRIQRTVVGREDSIGRRNTITKILGGDFEWLGKDLVTGNRIGEILYDMWTARIETLEKRRRRKKKK